MLGGMSVLILFAHPAFQKSRANRALVDAVAGMDGVTFHDLYEAYPDLHIDVAREQSLLRSHDTIVFQHPFYWYSVPAILKEWQDLVLEWGFAYGDGGEALRGKATLHALTAGGPASSYGRAGYNYFTIRELLAPFEATARLCKMTFLEPFVVHATQDLSPADLRAASKNYRDRITELRDRHE
jgi:glutathione-regulated potassium-efflux system ancillary protein KefG